MSFHIRKKCEVFHNGFNVEHMRDAWKNLNHLDFYLLTIWLKYMYPNCIIFWKIKNNKPPSFVSTISGIRFIFKFLLSFSLLYEFNPKLVCLLLIFTVWLLYICFVISCYDFNEDIFFLSRIFFLSFSLI